MLMIQNDGARIATTTYWASDMARAGYAYLTWNAGTGRLLVPGKLEPHIADMRTA